jgi:hypothetical protein
MSLYRTGRALFALALSMLLFPAIAHASLSTSAPLALAAAIDWSPIVTATLAAAQALITLLVPILGALLAQWLRSKIKSEKAQAMFDHVADIVHTEVRALMQSTLPEVREAMKDGKITPEEARRLRTIVIDTVKQTLGTDGEKNLRALLGDRSVDSFLTSVIESAVLQTKTDSPRISDIYPVASLSTPPAETITPPPLSTASGEVLR